MIDFKKKVKPAKGEWPYVILGIILFFGSIFLFVAEIDNYGYTIQINRFILVFGILGFLLSLFLSWYYGQGTKGIERLRLTLLFVIFITLIVPVWAHFLNHTIALNTETERLEVFENSLYQSPNLISSLERVGKDGFYLFFVDKTGLIKVHTKNPALMTIKAGEFIDVDISRGLMGFRIVDREKFE